MSRIDARGMDPASLAILTAANAADACRQIWQLCELWRDAPKDIMHLRDELARANDFFSMVQLAVTKHTWVRTADWVGQLTYELEECFQKAETVVRQIQTDLKSLLQVSLIHGHEVDSGEKERRVLWLKIHKDITRHRGHLKDVMFQICAILALLDRYKYPKTSLYTHLLTDAHSPGSSETTSTDWAQIQNSTTYDFPGAPPITDLSFHRPQPEEVHARGKIVLFDGRSEGLSPNKGNPPLLLERYSLQRHQDRPVEQKRLGAGAVTLPAPVPRSYCLDGCICACHSVKDWGRWALHSPFLGSIMISYRGVTQKRPLCSNPRCKSSTSQAKLVRMDILPPTWLVRATMSVFLSFGMPNPEMVIRVSRVTEQTDVHSSMNQLLWAIQREEAFGVRHFLQGREVRPDDIYGPPSNGFTPLRLALDRKAEDVAQLL